MKRNILLTFGIGCVAGYAIAVTTAWAYEKRNSSTMNSASPMSSAIDSSEETIEVMRQPHNHTELRFAPKTNEEKLVGIKDLEEVYEAEVRKFIEFLYSGKVSLLDVKYWDERLSAMLENPDARRALQEWMRALSHGEAQDFPLLRAVLSSTARLDKEFFFDNLKVAASTEDWSFVAAAMAVFAQPKAEPPAYRWMTGIFHDAIRSGDTYAQFYAIRALHAHSDIELSRELEEDLFHVFVDEGDMYDMSVRIESWWALGQREYLQNEESHQVLYNHLQNGPTITDRAAAMTGIFLSLGIGWSGDMSVETQVARFSDVLRVIEFAAQDPDPLMRLAALSYYPGTAEVVDGILSTAYDN